MNLSIAEIANIRLAALTCDIGMVALPTTISRKEGELSPEESRMLASHPQFSVNIVSDLEVFKDTLPLILHHHEQWDGQGYPQKLASDDIPIGAQILAVADAFVHMQVKRANREAKSPEDALQAVVSDAGTRFSPRVVDSLVAMMSSDDAPKLAA
jgi:HD-GYP domain-containing protein (c-di-GMP phosphodiesterase class II)